MAVGGFSTEEDGWPRPLGAEPVGPGTSLWRLHVTLVPVRAAWSGTRRIWVIGPCAITDSELSALARKRLPSDVAWRWPGSYAVIEESPGSVALHTDPVSAFPLYVVPWKSGWAWSTSARLLAALIGSGVDTRRLACAMLAPSVPALSGGRTFFTDVRQAAPGCRTELPSRGTALRGTALWRPRPEAKEFTHRRLRHALMASVALRAEADLTLSSDLSGGLDSSTIAVLAARALPASHRLKAVTVHPEGDHGGADLRYARLIANASGGMIAHHLFPLSARHLPYSRITAVPPTDEPAPSTLTQARLCGQFRWMRDRLGTRTHLTGDGGDSVLFQPPAHLADLVRHGRLGRAVRETLGWARLRRTPVAPLLWDAVAMARTSRATALADLAGQLTGRGIGNRGNVRWFSLPPLPDWAEAAAVEHLAEAARRAAGHPDILTGLDASQRILVDEIREVARTAAADDALAAHCGIALHNPFLDPAVVNAVLANPLGHRPAVHAYKPLLVRALGDLLPPPSPPAPPKAASTPTTTRGCAPTWTTSWGGRTATSPGQVSSTPGACGGNYAGLPPEFPCPLPRSNRR